MSTAEEIAASIKSTHTHEVLKPLLRRWRRDLKRVESRSLYYGRIITAVYNDDMTAFSHWLETHYIQRNSAIDVAGDTRRRIEAMYQQPSRRERPRTRSRATPAGISEDEKIERQRQDDAAKKYICPYEGCPQRFKSKWHLERHIRTHQTVRRTTWRYRCRACAKKFVHRADLWAHAQVHDQGRRSSDRILVCPVEGCDTTFPVYERMQRHMRRVHNEYGTDTEDREAKREKPRPEITARFALLESQPLLEHIGQ